MPDRPKPKHKKAARNSKEAGSSSSNRNKNKRTEGQAVKSSTRAVSSPTPEAAEPEAANTSVASGSSEGPSEGPSGSSQETLPDSGYSQSQELFSPNEEEEQRQDGKSLPPGFVDKRSRTIATSRYVAIFVSQFQSRMI